MRKGKRSRSVIAGIFSLALVFGPLVSRPAAASPVHAAVTSVFVFDTYYRTELFFGRSIPGGGLVTDAEWEKFLAETVTPRFPDGFTIVKASGQYREKNGTIDKEPSEVLIFLYPARERTASRRKIDEIRRAYVRQFKQESVLRLDYRNPVSVSF